MLILEHSPLVGNNSPSSVGIPAVTCGYSHSIRTINDIPECQPYRMIPPIEIKAVKEYTPLYIYR